MPIENMAIASKKPFEAIQVNWVLYFVAIHGCKVLVPTWLLTTVHQQWQVVSGQHALLTGAWMGISWSSHGLRDLHNRTSLTRALFVCCVRQHCFSSPPKHARRGERQREA